MIISHVLGGIGNQMFQYAAARALSLTHHHELLVDLSSFESYSLHNGYELNKVFSVNVKYADKQTVSELLSWRSINIIKKLLRRKLFSVLKGKSFVIEPGFSYWSQFFDLSQDCYLHGYWQSELYFKSFERIIREDFTFREPLDERNSILAAEIHRTSSVSLHVRRGDYISDNKTSNIMGVCSLKYYQDAIKYISQKIDNPVFYIFSDDIEWVKRELIISFPCVYIDFNQQSVSYKDMQLMSLCKCNIIANSSFSWWGAWLNINPEKIVIAPNSWFCNGTNDQDLIPYNWLRL
jgi:hypothetical protein